MNALFVALTVGGGLLALGAVLNMVFLLLDFLLHKRNMTDFFIAGAKVSLFMILFGLPIFGLALAGLSMAMAIEGIQTGAYDFASRHSHTKTHIDWSTQPIRFTLQTLGLLGFSGYLLYFAIGMGRDMLRDMREKGTSKKS